MTPEVLDIKEPAIIKDEVTEELLTIEVDVAKDETNDRKDKTTVAEREKTGFRRVLLQIQTDKIYRQRMVHTVILCWSFFALGWSEAMLGPTFPDLRQIIQEDVSKSSWLFTVGSIGYLCGSLLGGIVYDKLNKALLLAVCSLGSAVCTLLTPYCSTFSWMMFIKLSSWFFFGGLETCVNADIIHVWESEVDPYIQALYFASSIGMVLSPIATKPFLAGKTVVCDYNFTFTNISGLILPSTEQTRNVITVTNDVRNVTFESHNSSSMHATECTEQLEETRVYYAFLIATVFLIMSVAGYVYLYVTVKLNKEGFKAPQIENDPKGNNYKEKRKVMSIFVKVVFITLLSSLLAAYCIAIDNFAGFFMTFSLDYLKWDKSKGSFATAVFWFTFAVGRFAGIFLVSCCRNSTMLIAYLLILVFSFTGFVLTSLFKYHQLIWVFISIMGFAMSVIVPAVFSWTSEHVIHVSGKMSALFLTSAVLAGTFVPLLIGYLMEHQHPMWFAYILVTMAVTCLLLYVVISVLYKCYIKKQNVYYRTAKKKESERSNF